MLLHLFQFGDANSSAPEGERNEVREEIAYLIRGVLRPGGETTELDMRFLLKAEFLVLGPLEFFTGIPLALFCNNTPEERIGTAQGEANAYAAVIALMCGLSNEYDHEADRRDFSNLICTAVQQTIAKFSKTLPIGDDRNLNYVYDASGALVRDGNGQYVWCDIDNPTNLEAGQTCKSVKRVNHIPSLNPDGALGKVFCWESFPTERVMGGGTEGDGLLNAQIIDSYQQSPSIVVMKEGAGLDYLLPMSMLIRLSGLASEYENSSNPIFRSMGAQLKVNLDNILGMPGLSSNIHIYDDSRTPYLPICASDPVTVAADTSNYFFRPCQLQFPRLAPDSYDFPTRNDSYFSARSIQEWGVGLDLSLDRYTSWRATTSSPMEYRYVPNTILRDETGHELRIMPGVDHDFMTFLNRYYCKLFIEGRTEQLKLVVDGKLVSGNTADLLGGTQHIIMIAGPLMNYRIFVIPQLDQIIGDLQTADGSLNVDLSPDPILLGYHGHLLYRSGTIVLEASNVQRIHGGDYLCIFEGEGELNGLSGHTFRIAVNLLCPRTISIEIKHPDGTIAYAAEGIAYTSGDLHLRQRMIP
jgi:hypothetical protein